MNEETKSSTQYVMVESSASVDEDEIDLLELIRALFRAWKIIVGVTILCIGLAVAYALHVPQVYKAVTVVTGAKEERNDPPFLLGEIEGLAAMAGISIPYNSNIEIIVKTIMSRSFLKSYIAKYDVDFSY